MTVSTSSNRADHTGNGSASTFSFTFRIFSDSDLKVTRLNPTTGVETVLALTTDYTVSGAGSYNGGSITLTAGALTNGHKLAIVRELNITQTTDLRNQGSFFAETHEDVFDRQTMILQQLQEQIDRAAKLPVTNTEDTDALVADIVRLADSAANIDTVAGISGNVTTVAGIQANVTTVAGVSGAVSTVAGVSSAVSTVSAISANVTTVAGISAAVSAVGPVAAGVSAVAAITADVTTVAANIADVQNAEENATAAVNAKTAAEAARDAALAALDSFDDRYLGQKTSDPALDNDGNALVAGALYFNTVDGVMKVYEGSLWVAAYASLSGALLTSNNLSDLTNTSTARTNIGLSSASQAEMEAGTEAGLRSMSPLRVRQAISANAPQAFPSGTRLLFQQTAAPTGWTKDTTHNNKALRVVSGTAGSGGTVGFTTAFASQAVNGTVGSTTLTTAQMPSHTHSFTSPGGAVAGGTKSGSTIGATGSTTGATGGGGSHNHTFAGTAIDLAVQYVDVIIATKD